MRVARESTHSHTKDSKYRKSICYLIATQCVITNAYIIQFGRSNSNTHIRKNNATLFGVWHYLLPLFTKCTLICVPLHKLYMWILESISLAKSSATLCTVAICLEMEMAGAFFGGSTIFISIQWFAMWFGCDVINGFCRPKSLHSFMAFCLSSSQVIWNGFLISFRCKNFLSANFSTILD